ncbi:hypothetical protein RhiirA1_458432 [Rhizophagus irregularis]|uniref:Uncharacterized protein n=1 Tax=Rhizophagus irregularis TaxID=588596 RepID=A0A2N0RVW7_9GLOM|nr:hypothetical protein RhiirA1_458432 [Rhizophagus irregularis]CAB4481843.1 unnamed protein product [Rhizophagus irregularis]CAB5202284.1 unnamed protein product [Rhizophagus irregularis]
MSYNKQMKNIIKPKKGYGMFNPKRSKDPVQQEIIEFTLDYQQHLRQRFGYTNDYEHASSDTSDDTKEVEKRPHKRDTTVNYNLSLHNSTNPSKRLRSSLSNANDSSSTGLSNISSTFYFT